MHPRAIDFLSAPVNGTKLALVDPVFEGDDVREGKLVDEKGQSYAIKNFIPRFVGEQTYAQSFGEQWNRYRRTQLDRFNGTELSKTRFFRDTGWSESEIRGQRILEAGCGAGRFTQIMLDAGAEVFSLDYSSAVDACWANNGPHQLLNLFQANIYELPFRPGLFDKVFCYGVLQHTPDVKRAFLSLLPMLKEGGDLAVDVYRKMPWTTRWTSKFWYRPITTRISRSTVRKIVEWYVPRWIPIDNFFQRVPIARSVLPAVIPCWNYTGELPLPADQVSAWAILDTFDALTPAYDYPQTIESVKEWFSETDLININVRLGGNGILANARKA